MPVNPTIQLSPLELAVKILGDSGKSLHVGEIANIAFEQKLTDESDVVRLTQRVTGALSSHIKTHGRAAQIKKLSNGRGGYQKGVYQFKVKRVQQVAQPIAPSPSFSEISSAYTGKAGEHAVMSELLFWGFNVSLMAVDDGIDIIATKNNKYFHVQVKTTFQRTGSPAGFTIKRSVFESNRDAITFYVLALREAHHTEFFVLPSSELHRLISAGIVGSGPSLSLRVARDPITKRFMLNKAADLTPFVSAFGLLN